MIERKPNTVSIKVTYDIDEWLATEARRLKKLRGHAVSRSDVVAELIQAHCQSGTTDNSAREFNVKEPSNLPSTMYNSSQPKKNASEVIENPMECLEYILEQGPDYARSAVISSLDGWAQATNLWLEVRNAIAQNVRIEPGSRTKFDGISERVEEKAGEIEKIAGEVGAMPGDTGKHGNPSGRSASGVLQGTDRPQKKSGGRS